MSVIISVFHCANVCKKPRDSTVPSVTLQGRGENNRSAYGTDKPKAINFLMNFADTVKRRIRI